jgi:hypothetical protein
MVFILMSGLKQKICEAMKDSNVLKDMMNLID